MISNEQRPDFTVDVTYLKGAYSLWRYSIPYFSAVVPVRFAKKYLHLVDDIPGAETIEWSIQELFQRDVAWDRVNKRIAKYLKNENRPQFFNALTVALIPKEGTGFDGEYKTSKTYPKLEDKELEEPIEVGGIQLYPYQGANGSAGKLRWDIDEIIAVAVDGQHRLAALQKVVDELPDDKLDSTQIPIIFIVPDSRVGFSAPTPGKNESPIASPLRRIFTDLNKHAKIPSRARQILLDDNDPESVCVRALIGEKLGGGGAEESRIPLALIDWLSEKNKIDAGPFITTILQLQEVVSGTLHMPPSSELSEDDPNFLQWLQNHLHANEEDTDLIMAQVRRCFNREIPLTLLPEQIEKVQELYVRKWRKPIFRIFSELLPYKELWSHLEDNELLRPDFVNLFWAKYILSGEEADKKTEKVRNAIKKIEPEWNEGRDFDSHITHINETIKGRTWAYYIVFQRALFRSFVTLASQSEIFPIRAVSEDYERVDAFVDCWVEAINVLLQSKYSELKANISGSERFWLGSGLKADDTVEFTKAGRDRITDWLNMWVGMYWLEGCPAYGQRDQYESDLLDLVNNSLKSKTLNTGLQIQARSRLTDQDIDEAVLKEEVNKMKRRRYEALRKLL